MAEPSGSGGGWISRLSGWGKLLKAGVYAVVVAVGYLVGVYVRLDRGITVVSSDVSEPGVAYEATGGNDAHDLSLSHRFREEFMLRFARVYFERSDDLPPPFMRAGEEELVSNWTFGLTWKGVAQNRSRTDPLFLSAVDVRVSLADERPFPWPELPVTPDVDVASGLTSISGTDVGLGPAMNVAWEVSNPTLGTLEAGTRPMLYHSGFREEFAGLSYCDGHPFRLWGVDDSGRLAAPLFLEVPDAGQPPSAFFRHEGQWYEEIQSLARLQDVTATAHRDSLSARVEFESLVGEPAVIERWTSIPESTAIFHPRPDLLEWDPRLPSRCVMVLPSIPPLVDVLLAVIPQQFTGLGPLERPSGVDVLVERLFLDVSELEPGESVRAGTRPDVFLNAKGALGVYVTLDRPQNGSYDIEWWVNGEIVNRTAVEALVPNALRFDSLEHVEWFRPESTP